MLKTTYEAELATYSLEPLGVTRNQGTWPEPMHQFSLVACARWESPYIVEWLNYHRSVGVDHVYLYCNDDDPLDLFMQVMPFTQGDRPFVTFHHYGFQGLQFQMYFHFLRNHCHETKWMMFLDIDEFVCIRGLNNIPRFMERFSPSVDAVYFNWSSFGHNGHAVRPTGQVLLNYTRREQTATPFTKVFIKSSSVPYNEFFRWPEAPVMHDYTLLNSQLNVRNVLDADISWYYKDFPSHAWDYLRGGTVSEDILATAFVAHYNIKSDEDFILRVKRGLKGDYGAEKMWGEKDESARLEHHRLTNIVLDTYLHDYWKSFLASSSWQGTVFPEPRWPLISEGKNADQTSTAHDIAVSEDARRIVSGFLKGVSQNHTNLEDHPWWVVDLGGAYLVHEARVFNRVDGVVERMANFRILASEDEVAWHLVFEKTDGVVYGGVDGRPYCHIWPEGFRARWIRLVVPGKQRYLHLDQIQFYGVAANV